MKWFAKLKSGQPITGGDNTPSLINQLCARPSTVSAFCIYNQNMESKDLNLIVNKKIDDVFRGYGFYIHFSFGKTITEKGFNKVGQAIEINHPEISLCIEDAWGFVKNGKNIIGTDLSTDPREQNIELLNKVDRFLEENFKPNTTTIEKYEKEEVVTTIFFSNGFELEINNEGDRPDDSDNWYLLIDDSLETK